MTERHDVKAGDLPEPLVMVLAHWPRMRLEADCWEVARVVRYDNAMDGWEIWIRDGRQHWEECARPDYWWELPEVTP